MPLFKDPNLGDLDNLTIDASSLYLIAAPSTPEEARQAVVGPAGAKMARTKCFPARARWRKPPSSPRGGRRVPCNVRADVSRPLRLPQNCHYGAPRVGG
jgi:hypothetical protein